MSFFNLFDFSGDPGEPDYFFDQSEYNTQKGKRDTYLGDLRSDRTRMRRDRDYYRGLERGAWGSAGSMLDKSGQAIGRSSRYLGKAAQLTDVASGFATDDSYRDSAGRIRLQSSELDKIRGEMGALRERLERPINVGNSKYSAVLRDAFSTYYASEKDELDTRLANSNLAPAAQEALKERLARGMLENVGKAEIQGIMSQEDADMRKILAQTNMLSGEAGLVGGVIDSIISEQDVRRAQQQDIMSAATGQLNVGSGQLNEATAYGNLGTQYMNRANTAAANTRFYDQSQLGVTTELLGDARDRMSAQEQLRMADASNKQAYRTYKAQSGQRGFGNLMKLASTGARIYMAAQTGGASELAAAGATAAGEAIGKQAAANATQRAQSRTSRLRATTPGGNPGGWDASMGMPTKPWIRPNATPTVEPYGSGLVRPIDKGGVEGSYGPGYNPGMYSRRYAERHNPYTYRNWNNSPF